MNEMYDMSIVTHYLGVIGILGVILVNLGMLLVAQDIRVYAKKMRIFMPIGASLIAVILFTGTVMMAAKHLEFSIENIIMIVFGIFLIFFELARYKRLKHLNLSLENPLEVYKALAVKILLIELSVTALISAWMLV